jgi:hypothetical protein
MADRARPRDTKARTWKLRRVRRSPCVYAADDFAGDAEIAHVLALAGDARLLSERGVTTKHDETGFSCELPVAGDATLEALSRRACEVLGLENDHGSTLRFRCYGVGESHRLHRDTYRAGRSFLIATAMLYLTDTAAGGETHFPKAHPRPLHLKPRRGRLVVWFNHEPDGSVDETSLHGSLPVEKGEKATLTNFIYQPLAAARHRLNERRVNASKKAGSVRETEGARRTTHGGRDDGRAKARGRSPAARFFCVNESVPEETVRLLREACERRGVEYVEVYAPTFDYDPARQLRRGDMLYRPSVSVAARRVEQFLYAEGVATFYADACGPFFECVNPPLLHGREGLPVPPTVFCSTNQRRILRGYVERLGGFPVVLKTGGGERGVGVMRADSFPVLFSLVDYVRAMGQNPLLSSYVPEAVHWRVVVVGRRAVASYRNHNYDEDFRTYAREEPGDYHAKVGAEMARVAVRAVHAIRCEFGGVDILEDPVGRLYLLEANFPCYYPQAQLVAGVDIAGAMVEHLLRKARRLAGG